jgi:hypothetical protein
MDKENFTPGPWKVSEELENFYEDCLTGLAVTTTGGRDICHVWNASGGSLPYKENAALIAAAPTMYQVLKDVAGILREKEYPYVARQGVALLIDILLKHVRGEK